MRDSGTNGVTSLHTDHLGSASVATTSSGALANQQDFMPWGTHRGGGAIPQTTLDYTGQRLDDTGLLYYHARYYDPLLGRFVSPDTMVPDLANPQDLNPSSYVHNTPIRYNDPSGRCISFIGDCAPIWQTGGLSTYDLA